MSAVRRATFVGSLLACGLAGGVRAEHATLTDPAGWETQDLPAPVVDGRQVMGARHRALLLGAGGHPVAAMELTELPQTADHTADLPVMVQAAQEQATADFAQAGLANHCAAPQPMPVAGRTGLRLDCVVQRAGTAVIKQAVLFWLTPAGFYSLSLSAQPASFDRHLPDYERAVATARTE